MAYAKTSLRAEKRVLREKMRAMGAGYREISAEFARRYKLRPRAAWREAYGWSLKEAAERINCHSGVIGLDPGGIAAMTGAHLCEHEAWPGFGPKPSGRRPTPYLLALLAAVYGCTVAELVDLADREHLPPAELLILDKYGQRAAQGTQPAVTHDVDVSSSEDVGGGSGMPVVSPRQHVTSAGGSPWSVTATESRSPDGRIPVAGVSSEAWADGDLVMAAAGESADRAAADVGRRVAQASIEQVQAEVRRLAHRYSSVAPLEFLAHARRVRDQACGLAHRTCRPRQMTDLQAATGAACGLMAVASFDLAAWTAAIEQAHAASVYAELADHRGLMAWTAGFQALIAFWCGRPQEALQVIGGSIDLAPSGTARARLQCIAARAWAHLGNRDQAREALAAADEERDRIGESGDEELHDEIAGEFGWGRARQAMCSASALLLIGDADGAVARANEVIRLQQSGRTSSVVTMKARIDLAQAEVSRGQLDGAEDALRPVWRLSPAHWRYSLIRRLDAVASELARPQYLNTGTAIDLGEQVRTFAAQSAPRAVTAGTRVLEPQVD
jgi:tetratricopeptide (TPR) repeat protein